MTTTQEQAPVEGSNLTPRCPIDQTPCLACGNTCMKKRIAELESQVFVPGQWRCAKCNFTVQKMTLDIAGDRVGVSDKDKNEPEKCPNGCGPLWRVTERDAGNRAIEGYESILSEIMKALDVTNYPAIVPAIDALRQPQAARLTEDELQGRIDRINQWLSVGMKELGPHDSRMVPDWMVGIAAEVCGVECEPPDLTAAPAQVTREEIARWHFERESVDGEQFGVDHSLTEDAYEFADAIMSLLAERGLVKESE